MDDIFKRRSYRNRIINSSISKQDQSGMQLLKNFGARNKDMTKNVHCLRWKEQVMWDNILLKMVKDNALRAQQKIISTTRKVRQTFQIQNFFERKQWLLADIVVFNYFVSTNRAFLNMEKFAFIKFFQEQCCKQSQFTFHKLHVK